MAPTLLLILRLLAAVSAAGAQLTVTTFAGSGDAATVQGTGTGASIDSPRGLAFEPSTGDLLVSTDGGDHQVRRITTPGAVVSEYVGKGVADFRDQNSGDRAEFDTITGVAVTPWHTGWDGAGHVLIADNGNGRLRHVATSTKTTTLASGLSQVNDVCVDNLGNAYVTSDCEQHYVRKAVFSSGAYTVSTLAGDGSAGLVDDTGTAARFNTPEGVRLDGHGNVFVVDCLNHAVRKVTPEGVVTTLVGTGSAGSVNGVGTAASFNAPYQLVIDANGDGYVTDRGNHLIRKVTEMTDFPTPRVLPITTSTFAGSGSDTFSEDWGNYAIRRVLPDGTVDTLSGSGADGIVDAMQGSLAQFSAPYGVAVDDDGNVFVTDTVQIRKISPEGWTSTVAGGTVGYLDGTVGRFNTLVDIAIGNNGELYVADLNRRPSSTKPSTKPST
eukprot:jgi/Tetstr1/461224/TSEL_006361.t1